MDFHDHSDLKGQHAFLGPSRISWIRYTPEKLRRVFINMQAAKEGTRKHAFASEAIALGQRLAGRKSALSRFVNESIGHGLTPDVILMYSFNCYGTADALGFRDKTLRVHEYKSGESGSEEQPMIYTALFCLEYDVDPYDINIIIAMYKGFEPYEFEPDPDKIVEIMRVIVEFDPILDELKKEMQL